MGNKGKTPLRRLPAVSRRQREIASSSQRDVAGEQETKEGGPSESSQQYDALRGQSWEGSLSGSAEIDVLQAQVTGEASYGTETSGAPYGGTWDVSPVSPSGHDATHGGTWDVPPGSTSGHDATHGYGSGGSGLERHDSTGADFSAYRDSYYHSANSFIPESRGDTHYGQGVGESPSHEQASSKEEEIMDAILNASSYAQPEITHEQLVQGTWPPSREQYSLYSGIEKHMGQMSIAGTERLGTFPVAQAAQEAISPGSSVDKRARIQSTFYTEGFDPSRNYGQFPTSRTSKFVRDFNLTDHQASGSDGFGQYKPLPDAPSDPYANFHAELDKINRRSPDVKKFIKALKTSEQPSSVIGVTKLKPASTDQRGRKSGMVGDKLIYANDIVRVTVDRRSLDKESREFEIFGSEYYAIHTALANLQIGDSRGVRDDSGGNATDPSW